MRVIALSLAASGCWGTSDFLAGLISRRLAAIAVVAVMQVFGLVVIAVVLLASRPALPGLGPALASVAAGAAGMLGLLGFYSALASGTMSIVAPIAATGVALPVIVGLLGGERLRPLQAAGLLVTIAGVVLASRPGIEPHATSPESSRRHRRSIALALLAAAGFGGYFTFAHTGARGGVLWLLGLSHLAALPLLLGLLIGRRGDRTPAPADLVRLCALGLVDLSATALYSVATRDGALSIVSVAGSLYPVATVLLARAVLRERVQRLQGAGVLAALAGVALLAAG